MESLDYFVGVDWGSQAHQLYLVDQVGSICAQSSFEHSGCGLSHMAAWTLDVTECPRQQLGIAIETPRGPVVESLSGQPSRSAAWIRPGPYGGASRVEVCAQRTTGDHQPEIRTFSTGHRDNLPSVTFLLDSRKNSDLTVILYLSDALASFFGNC